MNSDVYSAIILILISMLTFGIGNVIGVISTEKRMIEKIRNHDKEVLCYLDSEDTTFNRTKDLCYLMVPAEKEKK